ncbi:MAG: pseudouridine synthase [Erysipelotrichaceae bacterium]|nr:pseudouridine synthase [Erysipelotrichaceae bacterium]
MYNNLGNVKECKTLIKHGLIQVNGVVETNCKRKIQEEDVLIYQGKILKSQPFHYLMLNKPKGYLCANKDEKEKCVVDLIDYSDCFCLGRLDRDTTGLLILTNDKSLKKLLLPQNHVKKTYLVETKERLKKEDQEAFKRGIIIDQKIQCLPAKLEIIDDFHGYVTIEEGKYHQIKKMFLSLKNEVVSLKRISFDEIYLDEDLLEGMSRPLNKEERNKLIKKAAQC